MMRTAKVQRGPGGRGLMLILMVGLIVAAASLRQGLLRLLPTVTISTNYAEIPLTFNGEALLVRDERIMAAPTAGTLEWLVADGTRVAAHKDIFRILTGAGLGGLRRELDQVNRRLAAVEADPQVPADDRRLAFLAASLAAQIEGRRQLLAAGQGLAPGQDQVLADLWDERQALAAAIAARQSETAALVRQAQVLQGMVAAGATTVRAPTGGIVHRQQGPATPAVDLGAARRATASDVDAWLAAATENLAAAPSDDLVVAAGQPVARLATGGNVHLVLAVPADMVDGRREGERVEAALGDAAGSPLRTRIIAIGPWAADGRRPVVLEVLSGTPSLPPGSTGPVWVQWGVRRGRALPASALIGSGRDGQQVVVKSRRPGPVQLHWQPVEVVAWADGTVLVDGLAPGERVITRPRLISLFGWYRPGRGDGNGEGEGVDAG